MNNAKLQLGSMEYWQKMKFSLNNTENLQEIVENT